jgi:hypothetical protein
VNPETVRRLLVLGVCALGVTGLYLAPSNARSPHQAAAPRPQEGPTAQPSRSVERQVPAPTADRPSASSSPSDVAAPPDQAAPTSPAATITTAAATQDPAPPPASPRPRRTGATAFDPAAEGDDEAPEPVADITSADVSAEALTLRWPAAADNVGVVEYHVVLNGYEVATTPKTQATVRWFNDDAREHVVQVKAVDAAGNVSPSSPNLLVARPTPEPTPSATETTPAPADPTPRPTPAPTPAPSAPSATPVEDEDSGPVRAPDAEAQAAPTDEEN